MTKSWFVTSHTLLCLPVVCDVCHCLDNCLLSCIILPGDQVTSLRVIAGAGLSVHLTRDLSVLSGQCLSALTRVMAHLCPQEADELSRRRQLISKLHHIPGLVIFIHQTEACICIINCCSFIVCYLNCPLCYTVVRYSKHIHKSAVITKPLPNTFKEM